MSEYCPECGAGLPGMKTVNGETVCLECGWSIMEDREMAKIRMDKLEALIKPWTDKADALAKVLTDKVEALESLVYQLGEEVGMTKGEIREMLDGLDIPTIEGNCRVDEGTQDNTTGEVGMCARCGGLVDVVVPVEDRLQNRIATASRRGMRRRCSAGQFLGRELVVLLEKLGKAWELAGPCTPDDMTWQVVNVCDRARLALQRSEWPDNEFLKGELEGLADELVDMQTALCNMAAALGELRGEPVDLMRLACEKAEMWRRD